jgi:hypothetical protein
MKRVCLFLVLFVFGVNQFFSQSNPAEKKLEKIYELIDKNKLEKAEESLEDLLDEYSTYGKAWDLLAKIKYHNYTESKSMPDILGGNISVTTKDSAGNEIVGDSLGSTLMALLKSINPVQNN